MYLILIFIFFISLIAYYYTYFTNKANYWKKRNVRGPHSLPLLGNILENFQVPSNVLEERRYCTFGRVYGFLELTTPVLTVGEPELLKQIAIKDFQHFVNRSRTLAGDPVLAKTIINLKDDNWKRVRSIVSSTFTTAKIKRMFPLVNECAKQTIDYIDLVANTGKELQLKDLFLAYTLDSIARCAFGLKTNSFTDKSNEFLQMAKQHGDTPPLRSLASIILPFKLQKLFDLQSSPQKVLDYFRNLVLKVLDERQNQSSANDDFVKLLKDAEFSTHSYSADDSEEAKIDVKSLKINRKKLDSIEIVAQCLMFLGAGYHTSSTLLSYCVYTLAMNEEIQEKLFREIKDYYDKQKEIDYDSLYELQYLDAFINEALRHYPSFTNLDRIAGSEYTLGDTGITIEKGTVINLPFYAIHHDPEFYPEPHVFKPERFLPENRHKILPYTYLPFGLGPRNCIGIKFALLVTKVMIATFVNRFKAVRTANTVSEPKYNGVKFELNCEPLLVAFARRG